MYYISSPFWEAGTGTHTWGRLQGGHKLSALSRVVTWKEGRDGGGRGVLFLFIWQLQERGDVRLSLLHSSRSSRRKRHTKIMRIATYSITIIVTNVILTIPMWTRYCGFMIWERGKIMTEQSPVIWNSELFSL